MMPYCLLLFIYLLGQTYNIDISTVYYTTIDISMTLDLYYDSVLLWAKKENDFSKITT